MDANSPIPCPSHGVYRVPTCPICSAAQTIEMREALALVEPVTVPPYIAHMDRRQGKD